MYKASQKEPDSNAPPRCPGCGAVGVVVAAETLAAHVTSAESLAEPGSFCETDNCPVAYFDLFERTIPVAEARGLFWPKDPTGPLCNCHGLTADDVDEAIASGDLTRIRDVVRSSAATDAACGVRSGDGRPCAARVQRYFVRRRQELGG